MSQDNERKTRPRLCCWNVFAELTNKTSWQDRPTLNSDIVCDLWIDGENNPGVVGFRLLCLE